MCRAWRYGQQKPVIVYRLVAADTMEDCIFRRQISKHTMFLNVVDQASLMHRVSSDDTQAFLTLPSPQVVAIDAHVHMASQGMPMEADGQPQVRLQQWHGWVRLCEE